ncbi:MAG: transposase [Rubrobacter sp.]|nr:transposase [Rubrobacter sp.]
MWNFYRPLDVYRRRARVSFAPDALAQSVPAGAKARRNLRRLATGEEQSIERSFAWTGQNRRLSKDSERVPETGEAFMYVAMTRLMARRLARS